MLFLGLTACVNSASRKHRALHSNKYPNFLEVQERPVSRHLRHIKRDSVGMFREIYVMDGVDMLVGASDPNEDYWQGGEQK